MLDLISNLMWFGLGYTAFLQLMKILEKEFGRLESPFLILPCIWFTLLGGVTAVITLLFWMVWEWDGKFTHITEG